MPNEGISLTKVAATPQRIEIDGKQWTFTPIRVRDICAAETRVREAKIESYLRVAKRVGVPPSEQMDYLERLQGGQQQNGETDAADAANSLWGEIEGFIRSPAGIDWVLWTAFRRHHPKMEEDALPFSEEQKQDAYMRILAASGWAEMTGKEDEDTEVPLKEAVADTKPENGGGEPKPASTSDTA